MVHNGIEYGLMAAYAEGLNILHKANAGAKNRKVNAETPRLRNPNLTASYLLRQPTLANFSGRDSGEGRWTRQGAADESVPAPVLSAALYRRFTSRGEDDLVDKILSAMRYQFGSHLEKAAVG